MPTSDKAIGRLSIYRRLLNELAEKGKENIFSHELANLAGTTAAQVRRDLMIIGTSGLPRQGYKVKELLKSIENFLDDPAGQKVVLVGLGNLGRAILTYFAGRRPKLSIVAAFDIDPSKINKTVHGGCSCYHINQLKEIVKKEGATIGIITVPADAAQEVADMLIDAGIKGILNFAPISLRVRPDVYVEQVDITVSLEKVAYFARNPQKWSKGG